MDLKNGNTPLENCWPILPPRLFCPGSSPDDTPSSGRQGQGNDPEYGHSAGRGCPSPTKAGSGTGAAAAGVTPQAQQWGN